MRLTLRRPDDFHVHFRQGIVLPQYVRETAAWCARALVMPNTDPPIRTAADAARYGEEIRAAGGSAFQPLLTIKLLPETTPACIRAARGGSVVAAKLYPQGVTTNAEDGVHLDTFPGANADVLGAMEEVGMVLSLHGEMPGTYYADREERFLPLLDRLVADYPRLRIVLEHLSTAAAVAKVFALPDSVAATITVHHLVLTGDHVLGEFEGSTRIRPHYYCLPVAKRPEDRAALVRAATSGNPKFFFGSDSAPHPVGKKECAEGCGGIFTAPVALPLLAEVFDAHDALGRLEDFTSRFGAEVYQLSLNTGSVALTREWWTVPARYSDVIPFFAGRCLTWRVGA